MAKLDSGVTATVRSVKPSLESVLHATVATEFSNRGTKPVTLHSYALVWPAGRHVVSGIEVRLNPGQKVLRTVTVPPASGPLDRLTVEDGRVEVLDGR